MSIDEIRTAFVERFGPRYDHIVTHRWIGSIVRRKLHLRTQKSNGIFVIPPAEFPAIDYLLEKYGVEPEHSDDHIDRSG